MAKLFQHTGPQLFLLQPNLSATRHIIRHFLEAMRRHDSLLVEHGKRTSLYSLLLGRAMNMPDDDLSDLCHAALLHDLGKISLPNAIIRQHGLSMIGDYLMTECSPQAGAEILRPWPELQGIAKLIALHHERWDGSGIPFGMRGTFIPLGARILYLVDTVDQLLTQNPESIAEQLDTLIRILRTLSGTRFDPALVQIFIEICSRWKTSVTLPATPRGRHSPKSTHPSSDQTNTIFRILHRSDTSYPQHEFYADPHLRHIFELTDPLTMNSVPA